MTAAKTLAAISLATAFLATTSAWAQPAGSEYLPKIPKNPTHHSGGSASSTGESTTTTGVASDGSATGSASSSNRKKQKHARKKHAKAKPAKLTPAAADTSGAGDTLPIVLLVAVGVTVLVTGVVLRRRPGHRSGSWRD